MELYVYQDKSNDVGGRYSKRSHIMSSSASSRSRGRVDKGQNRDALSRAFIRHHQLPTTRSHLIDSSRSNYLRFNAFGPKLSVTIILCFRSISPEALYPNSLADQSSQVDLKLSKSPNTPDIPRSKMLPPPSSKLHPPQRSALSPPKTSLASQCPLAFPNTKHLAPRDPGSHALGLSSQRARCKP